MLPVIVEPDSVIELDTITAINEGTLFGGPELFPGSVVHMPPRLGGCVLVEFAKPLKLDGAGPPLNEFNLAHCAPQKVTLVPRAALPSPITKLPPATTTKTVALHDAVADEPPASLIVVVIV